MGLFSGLEKFGLSFSNSVDLFEEEKKAPERNDGKEEEKEAKEPEEKGPAEEEFLLEKTVRCKVCDEVFKTKAVKSGRLRRLEPDWDLRPRYQYVDTLKYDITSCPNCGYTAMNRSFDQIMPAQAKLVKEQISAQFKRTKQEPVSFYTYDMAIDRYKLSLANDIVKRARASEKAYTCLKLSWVLRGKAETMPDGTPEEKKAKEECKKEEEEFYQQAYDGFTKAISQENFPMCGLDESTVDYLLACMSYHFGKYDLASRFLASVLTSASASRRMKDLAHELKDKILAAMKKNG